MPAMGSIRYAYVDTPAGQIHVHRRAGTGIPIVLLHQTALSARSLDPLIEALALPHPLIAPDLPGFGNSATPAGDPTIADYARTLLDALDGLGVDRFHLFGHHTGATIAVEIAATVPQRTASAMLCGLPLMTAAERADFAAALGDPIAPVADGAHLLANWRYTHAHNPGCALPAIHDAVVDMLRNWRARPHAYRAVAGHDTALVAARVSAPVLLLSAPGDYFHAHLDRARALFPQAPVAITGGDNLQTATDPHGIAAAMRAFLAP